MSLLPEEMKTQRFPCPNCQQYISSETAVCKFCSMPITSDLKQSAVEKELKEKTEINLKRHKNMLIVGIVLLILGFFSILTPIIEVNYSNNVNINCLTPIFIILGIGITIISFVGYRKEKRKL